uniref:Uncharacterized protein n=1 Tax=Setaria viridis TaxID=4556 RepID=A0A4U6T244_SETVI|nr:hypothetical protein SEVIR_9G308150v2 [Setaria viridis]
MRHFLVPRTHHIPGRHALEEDAKEWGDDVFDEPRGRSKQPPLRERRFSGMAASSRAKRTSCGMTRTL